MTPDQLKNALSLLQWSRERLAAWSVVPIEAVKDLERGDRPVSPEHMTSMRTALKDAGVIFIEGDEGGVTLRKPDP